MLCKLNRILFFFFIFFSLSLFPAFAVPFTVPDYTFNGYGYYPSTYIQDNIISHYGYNVVCTAVQTGRSHILSYSNLSALLRRINRDLQSSISGVTYRTDGSYTFTASVVNRIYVTGEANEAAETDTYDYTCSVSQDSDTDGDGVYDNYDVEPNNPSVGRYWGIVSTCADGSVSYAPTDAEGNFIRDVPLSDYITIDGDGSGSSTDCTLYYSASHVIDANQLFSSDDGTGTFSSIDPAGYIDNSTGGTGGDTGTGGTGGTTGGTGGTTGGTGGTTGDNSTTSGDNSTTSGTSFGITSDGVKQGVQDAFGTAPTVDAPNYNPDITDKIPEKENIGSLFDNFLSNSPAISAIKGSGVKVDNSVCQLSTTVFNRKVTINFCNDTVTHGLDLLGGVLVGISYIVALFIVFA